jgi:hypothetical protein
MDTTIAGRASGYGGVPVGPQTEMARRMAAVVGELKPLFQARGFRKRRNTFNRETEPGLVHVVSFAMGRYELYGEPHDPFSGEYGFYWILWGVYVEEIARRLLGDQGRDFVTEPNCELRLHSGVTESAPRQGWYLGEEPARLIADATSFLKGTVFPYLDRLSSREAILRDWERAPESVPFARRRLAIAMLELERGNVDRAVDLVRQHLQDGDYHPSHRDWVMKNVAPQFGERAASF